MPSRQFDLVVFGATGFTGRLVAEYLQASGPPGLRWALAGRSMARLAEVRRAIGASAALPLVEADAADAAALARMAAGTSVVITTVGPYQLYGEPLVRACAEAGTDYVDLCGEPLWMARMIPLLEAPARASGARIVFSCGFDSIPFDLGVLFLQHEAMQRLGAPLTRVAGRVNVMKGTASGGTLASGMATAAAIGREPALARVQADAFALTPGFRGPPQPDSEAATFEEALQRWSAPFMMAPINVKNIHRTHFLRGHPWGAGFVYDERMLARNEAQARQMARTYRLQNLAVGIGPVRRLLQRFVLPKPGEGPSREQRERGRYELLFAGWAADGRTLRATVTGDRDPGYGSTSKMIAEAALCLAFDVNRTMTTGGVWTPAAAMGLALLARLRERAGLAFSIEAA